VARTPTSIAFISRVSPSAAISPHAEPGTAAYVQFALLATFLTGAFASLDDLDPDDFRHGQPRFQGENLDQNLAIVERVRAVAGAHRATPAHFLSEVIATLGLLLVIFALARSGRGRSAPAAVGAYIGAAYWFTSSTSFANPAITIGRMFSDTFAGIAPGSVLSFIGAQIIGGALAIAIIKALYPAITPAEAADIIVPHRGEAGRAPASAAHRNASLSADRPQGPASLTGN